MENERIKKTSLTCMDTIRQIIKKKPIEFLFASLFFVLIASLIKWGIHPTGETAWFIVGGMVGIYFMDVAEVFFALEPSPFHSIVFMGAYAVVSLFVTTSSSVSLARGLVLSLFLQLLLRQTGEWRLTGSNASWYRTVSGTVSTKIQGWILLEFTVLFLVESYLFVR